MKPPAPALLGAFLLVTVALFFWQWNLVKETVSAPHFLQPNAVSVPSQSPKIFSDSNQTAKVRTTDNLTVGERKAVFERIIPHGTPFPYGNELGISFDEPEIAISVLSKLDGDWVNQKNGIHFSDLNASEQQRFLAIGSNIACEFCCGARTLVAKDGKPACSCAHSAAMRGLAKYLLQKHAIEFSDQQILEELTKIKTISFPKQMVQRALELKALGKDIDAETQNLPSQVGGC